MKKTILMAVLLVGAGVATSRAGVAFGINVNAGPAYAQVGYENSGCAQPFSGYAYTPGYNSGGQYVRDSDYVYDEHGALHGQIQDQHLGLHQALHDEHAELHRDLNREHEALHVQLRRELACGVPLSEIHARHEAAHRQLSREHALAHVRLQREHAGGHWDLQQQHRDWHDAEGW